jgi:hypothetical protein
MSRRALGTLAFGLMALGGATPLAADEEVLLLLPKNFDVRPLRGWSQRGSERREFSGSELKRDDGVFRFRGEEVTQGSRQTDHHRGGTCDIDTYTEQELRATFRRGVLRGRWTARQRNYFRNCSDRDDAEYMRWRSEGEVSGQADADGRLTLTTRATSDEILDREIHWVGQGSRGRFVTSGQWTRRNQAFEPWSYSLEFQLPVGELQSSQKLSPPRGSGRAAEGTPSPDGPDGPARPPADEPPTPAETAGATVGSGLLLGIGAWLYARANGTGLGDLLGGLSGWATSPTLVASPPIEQPPLEASPVEATRILFQEPPHRDGERNDRGEVWDARIGGWVGENLYAQDRQREAWLAAKDGTDLEAMRRPDELANVAGQVAAGDQRLAERGQAIAERDAQLRREAEDAHEQGLRLGFDPQGQALRDHFAEQQKVLEEQGYRVLNPGYDQALPVEKIVDGAAWVSSWVRPGQAVRCQEFADLGAKALQRDLDARYGADAGDYIVDSVVVDAVRDASWAGRAQAFLDVVTPKNHIATRVTLPDGRRFVLDYWDASRGAGCQMVSEEEWLARWRGRIGEDAAITGSGDFGRQMIESRVDEAVAKVGGEGGTLEQGLARFREKELDLIRRGAGTETEKATRIRQVDTLVRSYRRCGGLAAKARP